MSLPELTAEQRAESLRKAMDARKARAAMKREITEGQIGIRDVLAYSDLGNEIASRMRCKSLLESMPGIGSAKARRIMEEFGISEARRIKGLGRRQRQMLLDMEAHMEAKQQ